MLCIAAVAHQSKLPDKMIKFAKLINKIIVIYPLNKTLLLNDFVINAVIFLILIILFKN